MRFSVNIVAIAVLAACGNVVASAVHGPQPFRAVDHRQVAARKLNLNGITITEHNGTALGTTLEKRGQMRFSYYYPEESGNEVACGGFYNSDSWVSEVDCAELNVSYSLYMA